MTEQLYAVWPGTVTLYNGSVKTWTAADLATAYGLAPGEYIAVNSENDLPRDPLQRMLYIELKPRPDDYYQDIKYTAEDDGQVIAYRPDFDASKRFIQETDPRRVDPEGDVDFDFDNRDN